MSTNVPTRQDGYPRSNAQEDRSDPGVAVYFTLGGGPKVLACDRWDRVADNIAAIAAHVGALRGQERWGVGSLEQAFAGYAALPARATSGSWREVLEVGPDAELNAARAAYTRLVRAAHPDHGGTVERLDAVRAAWGEAQRELAAVAGAAHEAENGKGI